MLGKLVPLLCVTCDEFNRVTVHPFCWFLNWSLKRSRTQASWSFASSKLNDKKLKFSTYEYNFHMLRCSLRLKSHEKSCQAHRDPRPDRPRSSPMCLQGILKNERNNSLKSSFLTKLRVKYLIAKLCKGRASKMASCVHGWSPIRVVLYSV